MFLWRFGDHVFLGSFSRLARRFSAVDILGAMNSGCGSFRNIGAKRALFDFSVGNERGTHAKRIIIGVRRSGLCGVGRSLGGNWSASRRLSTARWGGLGSR